MSGYLERLAVRGLAGWPTAGPGAALRFPPPVYATVSPPAPEAEPDPDVTTGAPTTGGRRSALPGEDAEPSPPPSSPAPLRAAGVPRPAPSDPAPPLQAAAAPEDEADDVAVPPLGAVAAGADSPAPVRVGASPRRAQERGRQPAVPGGTPSAAARPDPQRDETQRAADGGSASVRAPTPSEPAATTRTHEDAPPPRAAAHLPVEMPVDVAGRPVGRPPRVVPATPPRTGRDATETVEVHIGTIEILADAPAAAGPAADPLARYAGMRAYDWGAP